MKEGSFFLALLCSMCWTSCSLAEPCIFGKAVVHEAETFFRDSCTSCACQGGKLVCTKQVCPELNCGYYEDPGLKHEGDCCPVCIPRQVVDPPMYVPAASSCLVEGTDLANPCLSCSCQNGHKACLDISGACLTLECPRGQIPVVRPGECCPTCPPTLTAPPTCIAGRKGECQRCTCINGEQVCYHDTRLCPGHEDPTSTATPEVPRERCEDGSTRSDNCKRCYCKKGKFECKYDRTLCLSHVQGDDVLAKVSAGRRQKTRKLEK